MRIAKIGKYRIPDNTPGTIFASNCYTQLPSKGQVLDLENYSLDKTTITPWDDETSELTRILREDRGLKYYFKMEKLRQRPMLTYQDGCSMILPLDNDLGVDWLTYRDPRWKEFIYDLANRLWKNHSSPEEEASIKTLLVDYAACVPFSSMIRQDGRLTVDEQIWDPEDFETFSSIFGDYLYRDFKDSKVADCLPPLNVTKSCGFNTMLPDGTPYSKEDLKVVPEKFDSKIPNNIWRYNTGTVKKLWLESGRVTQNLVSFLNDCDRYTEPKIFLKAFKEQRASVHTEAYRTNNADVPIIEFDGDFNKSKGHGYKKNREWAKEIDGGKFVSAVLDDKAYEEALRAVVPGLTETVLKKRPMFPGPNASFSPPFIYLFRALLHHVEDSSTGFPSNREVVLERYSRVFKDHEGWKVKFVTFDRRTSEQFITDNWKSVLRLFPQKLANILKGLGVAALPSLNGVRVVNGGLTSGTAQTTFVNASVGCYEMSNLIKTIFNQTFKEACTNLLDMLFNQKDYVVVNEKEHYCCNLGTDDQVLIYFYKGDDPEWFKTLDTEFGEPRALSLEVVDECTVFGMDFKPEGVFVAKTLGLSKIFLMEKTLNGDMCALKMAMRLRLLEPYLATIQECMTDHKMGSLKSYDKGAANALKILNEFGFPIDELLFNQFSPAEKVSFNVVKDTLNKDSKLSLGSLTATEENFSLFSSKKIPIEYVSSWREIFDSYFGF